MQKKTSNKPSRVDRHSATAAFKRAHAGKFKSKYSKTKSTQRLNPDEPAQAHEAHSIPPNIKTTYDDLTQDDLELLKFFNRKQFGIISRSKAMVNPFRLLMAYKDDEHLLLTGDRGVGKGIFVKAIHKLSNRSKNKLIEFNCASREKQLLASELFGSKKGAYTGADRDRIGLIQAAGEGTLFIDEVWRLSLEAQGILLRVLQEGEFTPIGGTVAEKVKARIICATNQDLQTEVANKKFHADLYDRMNVTSIDIPNLSERSDDIPLLAKYFYDSAIQRKTKDTYLRDKYIHIILEEDFRPLKKIEFEGNVRVLKNEITSFVSRNWQYLEDFHSSMIYKLVTDHLTTIKSLSANPVINEKFPVTTKHWIALHALLENGFNQVQAKKYSAMRNGPKDKISVLKYADTLLLLIAHETGFHPDHMIEYLKSHGRFSGHDETCSIEIENRFRYILSHLNKGSKKIIEPWASSFVAELHEQRPDLL